MLNSDRHGEFESVKAQYSTPIFLRAYWLLKPKIYLGKARALGALPAVATLQCNIIQNENINMSPQMRMGVKYETFRTYKEGLVI